MIWVYVERKNKKDRKYTDLQGKTQYFYKAQMMSLKKDPHHHLRSGSYVSSQAIQTYQNSTRTPE